MTEPMPPHPTFNAMLIADNAIREEGTGKISLIGIFANIYIITLPALHGSLCVYVNLGDAEGHYKLRLELVQTSGMRVIGRGEAQMEARDRMRPGEIVFELHGLLFDQAGRYEFVLYANDRLVGRKSFDVVKIEKPAGEAR